MPEIVLMRSSYFHNINYIFCCCCCSVAKSCSALCDPMDCNTSCFPVLPYLLEFAQIYVH